MNNYKKSFEDKLYYAMTMIAQFGIFKVPLDWFDVSVETEGFIKTTRNFTVQNTLEMFPEDLERMLKACAVTLEKTDKGYTFIANELTK